MSAVAMRHKGRTLRTDGESYWSLVITWHEASELDEYGDEVLLVYDDGDPVRTLEVLSVGFGRDRKAAARRFREWVDEQT